LEDKHHRAAESLNLLGDSAILDDHNQHSTTTINTQQPQTRLVPTHYDDANPTMAVGGATRVGIQKN
jgi:hypothetical protein